jgi:hypothetical protein
MERVVRIAKLYMRLFLILIVIATHVLLNGCRSGESQASLSDIDRINLEHSDLEILPVDSAVTNVRFVCLETKPDCLIESYDEIQVVDERIFIRSSTGGQQALFIFDMEGNHLLTINAQGRGPGEYLALRGFSVSPENNEICLLDVTQVLIYDYSGNHLKSHSFEKLGLIPCDVSPSLICFNGYFYVNVETFETKGLAPVQGWGNELMEDDMFNLVAVYDSDWKLVERSYPIPRERSGQQYRYQLEVGGQKKTFSTDGEKLYFHSIFSDYLYEVVDHKFIPSFRLDYGSHRIPENDHKEAVKIHEWQGPDYLFTFLNGNYGFPGSQYTVRGSQILLQPMIGRAEPLIMFDKQTNKSIVLSMTRNDDIGNMANLYPTQGIGTYDGGFFAHLLTNRIVLERDRGRNYSSESPLSPHYFPQYNKLSKDDNAVILFFDIKEER